MPDNQLPPFILYLHGFASGPSSTKARFFEERLKEHNIELCIPDLNYPSFQKMTLSSQIQLIEEIVLTNADSRRVMIAGSSMGGLLAVMAQKRLPQVCALVLMAPGFGLNNRIANFIAPDEFVSWRASGSARFYHYGAKETLFLDYEFVRDIDKHDIDSLSVSVPTIIFHGMKDETVPSMVSINFRQSNSDCVELYLVDDDHQLLSSLDEIWNLSVEFMRRQGIVRAIGTVT